MLATLSTLDDVTPDYDVVEKKYDGFRGLAAIKHGDVTLQSRNGLDLGARFPGVVKGLRRFKHDDVVLDGELEGEGFHSLQLSAEGISFAVFDVLWAKGRDVRKLPLSERRALLETLMKGAPKPLHVAERVPGPVAAALERAKKEKWEGVIVKQSGSIYEARRSQAWLKLKLNLADDFHIVGFVPHSKDDQAIGSLFLAMKHKGKLRFAGKVGTGFSHKLREELFQRLSQIPGPRLPDAPNVRVAHWTKPELIAEVAYTEMTDDFKLRHPSFQRLRDDKTRPATRSRR